MQEEFVVSILDYGAGNVRSLRNAIKHLGYKIKDISDPKDILTSQVIVFPGQGCFHQAIKSLKDKGFFAPLKEYLLSDRSFFGICLGMQLLFEGSEESPGVEGLGIIPGQVTKFKISDGCKVPQIAWNGYTKLKDSTVLENIKQDDKFYFVHSYCALPTEANLPWILSTTDYFNQRYISIVQKGRVVAAQFHPEKSGVVGLAMIDSFLSSKGQITGTETRYKLYDLPNLPHSELSKRVIACLDVRSNDQGDLVVTKGDQYDVRETDTESQGRGGVRNLGKPVTLCKTYYDQGADEIVFLNITSFRQGVIEDMPMLQVLESSSENVFVPLTVGGGIREYTDNEGKVWSSLEVASRYFRAGADKISIGSDAVFAAEEYLQNRIRTNKSSIELISIHYGAQAVVVSIDPKRVYVFSPAEVTNDLDPLKSKTVVKLREGESGPNGERFCWWQVTVKGGRETRDMDAIALAKISEILGAGEIMLNCIDMDGQGKGYDLLLIEAVQNSISIPVIASSGAGKAEHFVEVFKSTDVPAALAAGIFHRNEVRIAEVKEKLIQGNIPIRK